MNKTRPFFVTFLYLLIGAGVILLSPVAAHADVGPLNIPPVDLPGDLYPPSTPAPANNTVTDTAENSVSSTGTYQAAAIQVNADLWYAWNRWLKAGFPDVPADLPSSDTSTSGWADGLSNPSVTIGYNIAVTNDATGLPVTKGSTVTVGNTLDFTFQPYTSQDIAWFGTGYSMDSPYGEWSTGAAAPARSGNNVMCNANDYVVLFIIDGYTFNVYIPLEVNPPSRSLVNTSNLSCGAPVASGGVYGSVTEKCTVTGAGALNPTFDYSSTYGYFYYRYTDARSGGGFTPGCYGNNIPMTSYFGVGGNTANDTTSMPAPYQLSVPAYTIPYGLTATGSIDKPNAPTITGPTSGVTGTAYNYNFTCSDPASNPVWYGIDWTDTGVASQALPSTGTVPSGTTETGSKTWTSPGTYQFEAECTNSLGNTSSWSSVYSVVISGPASDSLVANPSSVISGSPSTLSWTSANATSCSIDNGIGSVSTSGGSMSVTPSSTTTYNITCSGPGGSATASTTVTVTPALPPAATNLNAACNTAGTAVTLSWTAAPGATSYYPRVNTSPSYQTPAQCTSFGWSVFTDNETCYPDVGYPSGLPGTSVVNFPVTPGVTYGWWVHSANASGPNWADPATGPNFTCNVPTDLTAGTAPNINVTLGQSIPLSGTVINDSTVGTGSGFPDIFVTNLNSPYPSTDGTAWNTIVQTSSAALGAGLSSSISTTLPASTFTTPGTYYYAYCADMSSSWVLGLTESNPYNNCSGWGTITVTAPVIPTVSCNVSSTAVAPGVPVTYTATPANGATSPYTWVPSDGVTGLGSASTAKRSFPTAGTYAMSVNASGAPSAGFCPNVVVSGEPSTCASPVSDSLSATPNRLPATNSGTSLGYSAGGVTTGNTCTITGPSFSVTTAPADSSCNVAAATSTTPAITEQSTYTMNCQGTTAKATVNIVPDFTEF